MESVRKLWGARYALIILLSQIVSCAAFMDENGKFSLSEGKGAADAVAARNRFLSASVFFASGGTVSQVVGSTGGRISNGGVTLDIPAGALSADTNISISIEQISETDTPGMTPVASKVILKPEGITFSVPVSLTMTYNPKAVASKLQNELTQIYYFNPATSEWELQSTTVDVIQGKLVAELSHFSTYGALHINIEKIVSRIITDSSSIRTATTQFRTYLRRFRRTSDRNNFYSLYNQTLLPFLNIIKAEYAPARDPLLSTFGGDDFDQDGARNSSDTYPYDPTNGNDTAAPAIVSGAPNSNVFPIVPGSLFVVTFNEPVNELSAIYSGFVSKDQNLYAPLKYKSISADRKTITYSNEFTLDSDENYAFYVNGVTDEIGNFQSGYRLVVAFHTIDVISPKVVKMEPEGMGLDPAGITQIVVHFSEPMAQAGLELTKLVGFGDPTLQFVSLSADNKIATFNILNTTPIRGSAAYGLQMDTSAKDLSGNPVEVGGQLFFFGTKDGDAPFAWTASPHGNLNPVSTSQFTINFNEPIDQSSLDGRIKLIETVSGTEVTLNSLAYDSTQNQVTANITSGVLKEKTHYTIKALGGIKDSSGNASTSAYTFTFMTTDNTNPSIVSITPENDLNLIYFSGLTIKVKFNEEMDRASLVANPINLRNITKDEYSALSLTNYDPVTSVAIYEIGPEHLGSYEEYSYSVPTDVTDLYGHKILTTRSGYFTTTMDTLTTYPPYVARASLVSCNSKFRLRTEFSRKMNFGALASTHVVDAEFKYHLERYPYVALPGITARNSQNGNCSPNAQIFAEPNPEFLGCLYAAVHYTMGIGVYLCWLLPTTIYVPREVPGQCYGYTADYRNFIQRSIPQTLEIVGNTPDEKTAVFSTAPNQTFNASLQNEVCESMQGRSYNWSSGGGFYWQAPARYGCDERNNTSLHVYLKSKPSSPSITDLNGKNYRFGYEFSNAVYPRGFWGLNYYSLDPKSNECSN